MLPGEADDGREGITLEDFGLFWRALTQSNLASRIGKFWFLIKPGNRSYIILEGACVRASRRL